MVDGFKQGLGDGFKIVASLPTDCDQTKGLNAAQDILTANPDVKAIYGACGPPILGAIETIKSASKTIKVVGFDAGGDEVKAIVAGDELASVAQFPAKWVRMARRQRSTRSPARRFKRTSTPAQQWSPRTTPPTSAAESTQ